MTPAQHIIIIAEAVIAVFCLFVFIASMTAIAHGAWWNIIPAAGTAYLAIRLSDDIRRIQRHSSKHT